MYGKIVEYRRYDPVKPQAIPGWPYTTISNVFAVDDAGTIFDPWTLQPWTPTDEWKLGETMTAEEWSLKKQELADGPRAMPKTKPQE